MKRQWITAGVIGICLVILGAVWILTGDTESGKQEKQSEGTAVWEDKVEIKEIRTENGQGGYHLSWDKEEAEAEGMSGLPLDESTIKRIREKIQNLTAERKIEGGQERLSDFGLENPAAEVAVTFNNGDEKTILVGDQVPDGESDQRYLLVDGAVLTVESSQVEGLLYGKTDLVSKTLTPEYPEGDESLIVTKVAITREKEEDLILEYADSQELSGYTVNSYQMVSPRDYPADAGVTEDVLPYLFGIEADAVQTIFPSAEEKEAMGVAQPWKTLQVAYTDESGEEKTFSLRVSRPENGMVYVMSGETEVIYRCSQDKLPWMEETEDSLVSHAVLTVDMKSLREMEITVGEERYRFEFQNTGAEEEKIICQGNQMDGESFRNFYYLLAGLSAGEVLFEEFPETASMEEAAVIRYRYNDGTEDVLHCFYEESRQIYAELNQGERGYRIPASQIETMVDTLKRLVAGEEIQARY